MNGDQELKIAREHYATNCQAIELMARAILVLANHVPEPDRQEVKNLIEPLSKWDMSQAKDATSGELLNGDQKTKDDLRAEVTELLMVARDILQD